MPDVKHMKWWGWGVEGVGFHYQDKPGFRPFVIDAIDLDVNTPAPEAMSLSSLSVPKPMISDELVAELTEIVVAPNAVSEDMDRIVHTYGKSVRDLMRMRSGDIPRVPDVVVYPANESEVQPIVDRAVSGERRADPVRRRQQHLRQPARPRRRDARGDLGRPRPAESC